MGSVRHTDSSSNSSNNNRIDYKEMGSNFASRLTAEQTKVRIVSAGREEGERRTRETDKKNMRQTSQQKQIKFGLLSVRTSMENERKK